MVIAHRYCTCCLRVWWVQYAYYIDKINTVYTHTPHVHTHAYTHTHIHTHTHTCSELAGLFLIDPAPETLFDANPMHPTPTSQNNERSETEKDELTTPWAHYWYHNTVPHLQSLHVSGSLGFNRLGLMLGLMSPVEVPELKKIIADDVITIKVSYVTTAAHFLAFFEFLFCRNIFSVSLSTCLLFLMSFTS